MKRKRQTAAVVLIAAIVFLGGLAFFCIRYIIEGENWTFYQANEHIYTDGEMTKMGNITDRNNNVLATTVDGKRVYSEDSSVRKATIHVVGDSSGYISTGVQNALRTQLTGYGKLNGIYTYSLTGNNMQLTIDPDVSVAAMNALGNFSGCVGVYNYKTGEVICMVSTPTYDIADEIDLLKAQNGEYKGVFVNRFLSSVYTPGSTFKMVTAAAALETMGDSAYTNEFICKYGTTIEGEDLSCVGRHNTVSLKRAFSHSCNAYFSQTALSMGKKTMTKYAQIFGFGKQFSIDGIAAATSSFNVEDARNIDFGWSGIGQYTVQMNPLQYLCAVGAVANGGEYAVPYLVKNITSANGYTLYTAQTETERIMGKGLSEKVAELMDYAVADNYGKASFGTLDVCGKTGTAEVGGGSENSLFVGFCKDEGLPLAFVVVVEDGGSGRSSALTVANKTLQSAKYNLCE